MTGSIQGVVRIGVGIEQGAKQGVRQAGSYQGQQGEVGIHGPDSIAAPEGAAM
jgi:hypothetical protein